MSDFISEELAYARQLRPAGIFILSAKYGLVRPNDQIDPYDVTLNTLVGRQLQVEVGHRGKR